MYREEFGVEILTTTDEKRLEPTDDGGVRLTCEDDSGATRRRRFG